MPKTTIKDLLIREGKEVYGRNPHDEEGELCGCKYIDGEAPCEIRREAENKILSTEIQVLERLDEGEVEKVVTKVLMPYYVVQGIRPILAQAICDKFGTEKKEG